MQVSLATTDRVERAARENRGNIISQSWERCRRNFKLAQGTQNPILRLMQSETRPRFESMIDQLQDTKPLLDQLGRAATSVNLRVVLTDGDLVAVNCFDSVLDDDFKSVSAGSCWTERLAGTNGVSLAYGSDECLTVGGSEHFYASLRDFACTGTPLFNAVGEKIGALAMVGRKTTAKSRYVLSEYMVSNAAREIQASLFRRTFAKNYIIQISHDHNIQVGRSTALVALGDEGQVIGATRCAERLFCKGQVGGLNNLPTDELFEKMNSLESMSYGHRVVLSKDLSTTNITERLGRITATGKQVLDDYVRAFDSGRLFHGLTEFSRGCTDLKQAEWRARELRDSGIWFAVEGETGTGKSLLIETIMGGGPPQTNVRSINCAAFGEAFDYHRSFVEQLDGMLASSNGQRAVIVFDNVDELPERLQSHLHDRLTGESKQMNLTNGRLQVVSTSRRNLAMMVEEGNFRSDLFYLIAQFSVYLPPLRVRNGKRTIINKLLATLGEGRFELTQEASEDLASYSWPGNIREAANVIRRAIFGADPGPLDAARFEFGGARPIDPLSVTRVAPRTSDPSFSIDDRDALEQLLRRVNWNVSRAAELVGKSRSTLNRRIAEFSLKRWQRSGTLN